MSDVFVRDAVVLAAGMGTRLRGMLVDRPKGLLEIQGEPLVGRSLRLLRRAGVERITIVAGFRAELYFDFARDQPDVRVLVNDAFETAGSMASLDVALGALAALEAGPPRDLLVLESDIVYEPRALRIASAAERDATLISGPTGAGDEVWVCADAGRLVGMSKDRRALSSVAGEFVGITRLSAGACTAMRAAYRAFVRRNGHGHMDYETGALVEVAKTRALHVPLIHDLCWGEIDDERQYERVVATVWPGVVAADNRVQ